MDDGAPLLVPDDAFLAMDEMVSKPSNLSKPLLLLSNRNSTSSDDQSIQGFHLDSSCCCLLHALGLMKQLFPNASTACMRSKKQEFENSLLPTMQSVIAENEEIIEAIGNMLQCPCSQDTYLLAIMSLIIFKVLDWYAAAARETPMVDDSQSQGKSHHRGSLSHHSEQVLQFPTIVGSYCIDGENQGRIAAQLVLSELHRVKRLVNLLSSRLKNIISEQTLDEEGITSPFSATMLLQLEADLCKRLRALSLEIVSMLRRG